MSLRRFAVPVASCALLAFAVYVSSGSAGCTPPSPRHVEIVHAPEGGDIAPWVKQELARARHDGRRALVYVGAKWCEPCQRFHRAAADGQLDQRFPSLRLLEFDLDRDRARLSAAGYESRMIPLFVLPGTDGRSSGRQIEGSVKGDGAVDEIAPRLRQLSESGG